jgi:hypothetical protein
VHCDPDPKGALIVQRPVPVPEQSRTQRYSKAHEESALEQRTRCRRHAEIKGGRREFGGRIVRKYILFTGSFGPKGGNEGIFWTYGWKRRF